MVITTALMGTDSYKEDIMTSYIRYKYMGRDMIEWNIEEMTGYKPISTYYTDFGIAEWYGEDAIRDTYDRAIENWSDSIEWMTEIVMVLNWKIWEHYHGGNDKLARFYDELWREAQEEVYKRFDNDKEAMAYYYRTID